MIRVLFFARIREQLGLSSIEVDAAGRDIRALVELLAQARGEKFAEVLNAPNVIVACNHDVVERDHRLQRGDEVAFYPPVTGG